MITNDFKGIMFGRKSVKVYDETVKIPQLVLLDRLLLKPSKHNFRKHRAVVRCFFEKLKKYLTWNAFQLLYCSQEMKTR